MKLTNISIKTLKHQKEQKLLVNADDEALTSLRLITLDLGSTTTRLIILEYTFGTGWRSGHLEGVVVGFRKLNHKSLVRERWRRRGEVDCPP